MINRNLGDVRYNLQLRPTLERVHPDRYGPYKFNCMLLVHSFWFIQETVETSVTTRNRQLKQTNDYIDLHQWCPPDMSKTSSSECSPWQRQAVTKKSCWQTGSCNIVENIVFEMHQPPNGLNCLHATNAKDGDWYSFITNGWGEFWALHGNKKWQMKK